MKRLAILLLSILTFSGCLGLQINNDSSIVGIAEVSVIVIAGDIRSDHPEKIPTIIKYCDQLLAQEDDEMFESMLIIGADYLADNIKSESGSNAIFAISRLLSIDKSKIDSTDIETARALITLLRESL